VSLYSRHNDSHLLQFPAQTCYLINTEKNNCIDDCGEGWAGEGRRDRTDKDSSFIL
jgi:hypothetical protein